MCMHWLFETQLTAFFAALETIDSVKTHNNKYRMLQNIVHYQFTQLPDI